MDRGVALVVALGIGGLIALQPASNNLMSRFTGSLGAAFVSLTFSTLIVGVIMVVQGEAGRLRGISHLRPEHLIGGLGGAAIVAASISLIRPLGATALTAALVTTQLAVSVAMDHFGWLGVDREAIDVTRVLGVLLLVGGTVLVTAR